MRLSLFVLLALASICSAVDRNNFKKCADSSFCKRLRGVQPNEEQYVADVNSLRADNNGGVTMTVRNTITNVNLLLTVQGLNNNVARVTIDHPDSIHPRYRVQNVVNEAALTPSKFTVKQQTAEAYVVEFGNGNIIAISHAPFRVDFLQQTDLLLSINSHALLHFEHHREKAEGDEDGLWEETFKTHKDTKPKGPSAIGVDISFPGVENVYGIPEHATALSLKPTKNPGEDRDPYRLYNLDVFEYELDETMALYGSIPLMLAHNTHHSVGVFFHNSAEMWIDVSITNTAKGMQGLMRSIKSLFGKSDEEKVQTDTHWMAESGIIDLFVFFGPKPADVLNQYSLITGRPYLPPLFSIAYHQCRWNYNDEDDVAMVDGKFDDYDIPYDVLWLDIEHTDGKRYFTWDATKFPTPASMQEKIATRGRKMVTIIDPHIKRTGDYYIHTEAEKLDFYIKNKDNGHYDGWCWPGSSSWLDFLNPAIQSWWSDQLSLDNYKGSTPSLYVWNDMNEPSVFNGPEVTMHKDAKHFDGKTNIEHRDVHNQYGMWQHAATAEGIKRRSGGVERPFVLSRAFFAGTQKYGAIWTGDNKADWAHLEASVPMLLSIGLAGLPFSGADVGGFFGNPEAELQTRWYQAGAYQPFFRGHAHLDSKRREPYLLDEIDRNIVRDAIRARYALLPFWYTLYYEASQTGTPVMRPLWYEYSSDAHTFKLDDVYLVGKDLLVRPVVKQGQTSVDVYFPGTQPWYDVETYSKHVGPGTKHIAAPMRKIPVFQRGGSIIPRKMRIRRSSALAVHDPFTLTAALDSHDTATGHLYIDDYHTHEFTKGRFQLFRFDIKKDGYAHIFTATLESNSGTHTTQEWIEKIQIVGFSGVPKSVTRGDGTVLDFHYVQESKMLEIKKPASKMEAFTIRIL